jgi:hypothetical protein
MRDQYVGDISDVLKFALLRRLAGKDRTVGVAWYYVPRHDGRADGRHTEWQTEPAWRSLDRELCVALATLPERSVAAVEEAPIWTDGTLFHREPMPAWHHREAWAYRKRQILDAADLVFLDPDNGLGLHSQKHASFAELAALRRAGRALAFITFPNRLGKHPAQIIELHKRLKAEAAPPTP